MPASKLIDHQFQMYFKIGYNLICLNFLLCFNLFKMKSLLDLFNSKCY